MGVTDLWYFLSEMCERKPLSYLAGKKVAVDLSGWVVQAMQCKGLNTSKNPHLRNLFFRVSHLLQNDVCPVFVTEGKPPALKEIAFKKRNFRSYGEGQFGNKDISRSVFDKKLKECQDLLTILGVPCVKSNGEAEALCAFLCMKGIVDGVITEDNDAFLYGAEIVFRDFSIDQSDSHVKEYNLKSEKNNLHLDRSKLIALALLLGCDYIKGLPGIGKDKAMKLLLELKDIDILQRFKDWKLLSENELFPGFQAKVKKKNTHCNRCQHIGLASAHKTSGCKMCDSTFTCYLSEPNKPCTCEWHKHNEISTKRKNELKVYNIAKKVADFPDARVVNEYLNYNDDIPDEENLEWKCPSITDFQEYAFSYLGWTMDYIWNKCFPIITSWQQYKLSRCSKLDDISFMYDPVKIIKERTIQGEDFFEVQWKTHDDSNNSAVSSEKLSTVERVEQFSKCYPSLFEMFSKEKKIAKGKKQGKAKSRKANQVQENLKITKYLIPKSEASCSGESPKDENEKTLVIGEKRKGDFPLPDAKVLCS